MSKVIEGDVVLGPQLLRKGVGGVDHVTALDPPVAVGGKLAQHQRGNGRLDALEADDLLLHAIFIDAEVLPA